MIHKPSLGSLDVPQKIWARSVQPFWRLLDTNKQTNRDRQAKFIYRLYIQSYNQNEHIDLLLMQKFGLIYFPFNILWWWYPAGINSFQRSSMYPRVKSAHIGYRAQTFKINCISTQKFRPMVVLKMSCFSGTIF